MNGELVPPIRRTKPGSRRRKTKEKGGAGEKRLPRVSVRVYSTITVVPTVALLEGLTREFHAAAEAFEVVVADRHRR